MAYPGRPVDQAITSKKIIANMKEEFRKMLNIPENHQSVGVITTDYPDILRCAVDDATKKTRVEVISFSPYYGGPAVKWSANSGSAYALISGDKVADVKSAMQSIDDYAEDCSIGGDYFGNYEGLLPKVKGRNYYECDIDTMNARKRGSKRIIYSDDGQIYYTDDHYESFTLIYGTDDYP